ncbi:MAG: N-acetylmuramoyl-L-alanine amidase [Prevotella sp.]|nr:N-acetylmuramoyl-L-alanine amidase [Prevotella sp.]
MFKKITFLLVFFMSFVTAAWAANGRFTLVIDPGHGGHDTGALGAISREKDINLNVALAFGRYVEQNLPDVRVVYTRKTDVFIPLHQRADIANKAKADLFISVHTNSVVPGHYAKGFQVYTLGMHRAKDNLDVAMRENSVISMETGYQQTYQGFDPKSSESYIMFEFLQNANMEKSVELARLIQQSVCSGAGRIDKGVHQAGFLVLRESYMPSCLIELGFITAADEEEYLNTPEGIDAMARGIYNAFAKYKNMYDTHIVVPYRAAENKKIAVSRILPTPPADRPRTVIPPATARQQRKSASAKSEKSVPRRTTAAGETKDMPLFKVQVFAVNRRLRPGSEQFHGHKDADFFQEGSLYKYTIGSSTDYNEINRLREKLKKDFPQSFIIAFKDGKRMNTSQAIAEFVKNRKK